jgi:hypothetical protein
MLIKPDALYLGPGFYTHRHAITKKQQFPFAGNIGARKPLVATIDVAIAEQAGGS